MMLINPTTKYKESYFEYILELGNEERYPFPLDFEHSDFAALLEKLADFKAGSNLPDGYVPSTTLWLVNDSELLGVTNIRHYLNENIKYCGGHIGLGIRPSYRGKGLGKLLMQQSIQYLKQQGVAPIHIHCYRDNLASASCIISNSGVLESEIRVNNHVVQRYIVA